MPALNFAPRFAALVKSGRKWQTIRARRRGGRDPKPGDTLHLYTGMRTKKCRKLGEAKCEAVYRVRIIDRPPWFRFPYEVPYCWNAPGIAHADGFECLHDLLEWFREIHGLPFEGLLIQWGVHAAERPA